jgi:hypothetical protein
MKDFATESQSNPALLTAEAVPQATLGLLRSALDFPVEVATLPYCGCARLFDGLTTAARAARFIGVPVAPWASAARVAITRCAGAPNSATAEGAYDNQAATATGGVGAEVIRIPSGFGTDDRAWGFGVLQQEIRETSKTVVLAPAAPMDRAFELTAQGTPYVEPFLVTYAGAFTAWVSLRDEATIAG